MHNSSNGSTLSDSTRSICDEGGESIFVRFFELVTSEDWRPAAKRSKAGQFLLPRSDITERIPARTSDEGSSQQSHADCRSQAQRILNVMSELYDPRKVWTLEQIFYGTFLRSEVASALKLKRWVVTRHVQRAVDEIRKHLECESDQKIVQKRKFSLQPENDAALEDSS